MKINLVYNTNIEEYKEVLSVAEAILLDKKNEFRSFDIDDLQNFGDFCIALGGDGTLLKAARYYAEHDIPVFGINQGRLGFLSQAGVENIDETIDMILSHEYFIEERMMLEGMNRFALNDFVIKGCDSSRTSKMYLEINGKCVCDYIADGLIVSTPTGSTAYGLSAGGPVLNPNLDAISVVPICPHTLNARPLVIPSDEIITVYTGDKPLSVTADGKELNHCIEKIKIQTSKHRAKLAFLKQNQFYDVIRNKLHWGIAPEG